MSYLNKKAGQIAYTFWRSILLEALAGADSGPWIIKLQLVKKTHGGRVPVLNVFIKWCFYGGWFKFIICLENYQQS